MDYVHKTHPRSRSLRLRIDDKGTLIVTTPPRTPIFIINRFLKKSEGWIKKKQAVLKQKKKDDTTLLYLGKKYTMQYVEHTNKGSAVWFEGETCFVSPVVLSKESMLRAVQRWLRSQAEQVIISRTESLSKNMGVSYSSISLREQKSRWGSCSSKKGVQLNWRLIHAPLEILEYVIMHELAHLQEMNHSKSFWNLVERFDAEYKAHRAWLRTHGYLLRS